MISLYSPTSSKNDMACNHCPLQAIVFLCAWKKAQWTQIKNIMQPHIIWFPISKLTKQVTNIQVYSVSHYLIVATFLNKKYIQYHIQKKKNCTNQALINLTNIHVLFIRSIAHLQITILTSPYLIIIWCFVRIHCIRF